MASGLLLPSSALAGWRRSRSTCLPICSSDCSVSSGNASLHPAHPLINPVTGISKQIPEPKKFLELVEVPISPEAKKDESIQVLWRGTDEAHVTKRFPPDGSAEFVLQALMIPTTTPYDLNLDKLVQRELSALCSENKSGDPTHYYRPTNRRDQTCVLCFMNCTAHRYGWIAVEFSHCEAGSCAFSMTYDMTGKVVSSKWGWDPDYNFTDGNKYKINYHYADCDSEWGLAFGIGNISML